MCSRPLSIALIASVGCSCAGSDWKAPPPRAAEPAGLATSELVAFMPDDDLWPRVSPDGRYVVFISQQNGNMDVWVRDYARRSTYPFTLDPVDDFDPDVAPVGQQLVYVSRRSDAKGDIYLAKSFDSGASAERLTGEASHDRQPTFSPDGRRIYFTQAYGVGDEFIAELDLSSKQSRRLSPGPGFDPAASPDGKHLVYTAPGLGPDSHPHLVALRLTDGATRAVTRPDTPAGFARFFPGKGGPRQTLIMTRFPDDDDASGALNAEDQASLWRVQVDFEALFAGETAVSRPFPLTDGAGDELFATVQGGYLYFTQGSEQQDILRLPDSGTFPNYEDPAQYFELADTVQNLRTRWFVLRCAYAGAEPQSLLEAQALLRIARLQEDREREDLARPVYEALTLSTADAEASSSRGQLRGLAEVALAGLDRRRVMRGASGSAAKGAAVRAAFVRVSELEHAYAGSAAVAAGATLERAEILVDEGRRVEAAELLELLVLRYPGQPESAARALLRRVDLLGVAYAPEAIGEAYGHVLERFPQAQAVVRAAAQRIVDVHLGRLDTQGEPEREVDALRRLVRRYGPGPVRIAARWRLVQRMEAQGSLAAAAAELTQLVLEAKEDRLACASALRRLAQVEERRGRGDLAVEAWRRLRSDYGDLPGFGAEARASITRVSLERARSQERAGQVASAAEAYLKVIEYDVSQVEAHRRYLALTARMGGLAPALEQAQRRVKDSPRTPVAHYALALALTWQSPPALDEALSEIEEALALNPQLVHAYITRGWIREMQELEDPGFIARASNAIVEGVGRALGGLLDVEIGKQGRLEQALEDYKTALRLNPEAQDAATEGEILLNLGNAHYRLAEQTNDIGNMRAAFERYLDALRIDIEHKDPRAELVFWERLGRAAGWVDEPAVGVMATRKALAVAKRSGLEGRNSQLVGNLALLYSLASEDAYAREALERFEAYRAKAEERSGWVVAVRDRARARLETVSARDRTQLQAVLSALASGRDALAGIKELDRGPLPSLWLPLGPDATRAQYGFDHLTELDVNLSLAESAHRGLGEVERAWALRGLRAGLTLRIIEEVPGVAMGFGDRYPTPLGVLRERLGLLLGEVRRHGNDGDFTEARLRLGEVGGELKGWLDSDRYAVDHPALRVDSARLWTLAAELLVRDPDATPTLRSQLQVALPGAESDLKAALAGVLTATTAQSPTLADRPMLSLTSTLAFTQTASAALAQSPYAGVVLEARVMQAKLAYAQGLLALWDAERGGAGLALGPEAMWRGLDAHLSALETAAGHFETAVMLGAEAGAGQGSRLVIMGMAALARLRWAQGAPEALCTAASQAAITLAENTGEAGLQWQARLLFAEVGPLSVLESTVAGLAHALPSELGASRTLVRSVLTRSASVALAKDQIAVAFGALDRALLLEVAAGPPVEMGADRERQQTQAMVRNAALLKDARRALSRTDAMTPVEVFDARRRDAQRSLLRARRSPTGLSEVGALRLMARTRDPEEIEYDIEAGEALLMPAPVDGVLHLFLVDGSTTTEVRMVHRVSAVGVETVLEDLRATWADAQAGLPEVRERRDRLRAALLAPVQELLVGKRTLFVAPGLLQGPLPIDLTSEQEPVVVHVSAPSALALSRAAQLVGVDGALVIERAYGQRLVNEGRRLSKADLMAFRDERGGATLEPGQARSLADRASVEALADRAQDLVVVEVPLELEPSALERSTLTLEPADQLSLAPDAFASELPLGALDLPARLLVLGQVRGPRAAWTRLDSALVARGFASSIMVPASAPQDAVQRLVQRVLQTRAELGPARALREAVQAQVAQVPQLALTVLAGSPGLDARQTHTYAQAQVRAARTRAINLLNQGAFEQAVPAFERWIRLQVESGETKFLTSAYRALVAVLERRLAPPDYARAAEVQEAFVSYLGQEASRSSAQDDARIDLGFLYSQAHDYDKAAHLFDSLLTELSEKGDAERVARAWYKYGLHHREALHYEASAEALERAIETWTKAGAYEAKTVPADAARALREVGEVYLNRLSDPVRAKGAYERARRYARSDQDRIGITLDLARVARRGGDFTVAAEQAARSQAEANKAGLEDLALSALIEAANVAWYQGDYRRGARLCAESLSSADRQIAALRKKKGDRDIGGERLIRRRKIYGLSVCGLVAMSQRDREAALGYLQQALRIAESLLDLREAATQHNNLGRVYLEFGEFEVAEASFEQAQGIDERLHDKYSLAYDLRNLGWALLQEGRNDEAQAALQTALLYSQQAKDTNNELRARFALAELARAQNRWPDAVAEWQAALPLAEQLDVKDLAWQIHRHLGNRAWQEGRKAEAERSLLSAVAIARTITGRAAPSALSPPRYAAFDDLARILLNSGRAYEAFAVVDEARRLEQLELLDDARLYIEQPEVPSLVQRLKEARTATTAAELRAQLTRADPRVAALTRAEDAHDLQARLPEGSAVLVYRVTDDGVMAFWLDRQGLRFSDQRLPRRALEALVGDFAGRLRARADLSAVTQRLSTMLLTPFAEPLRGTRHLALVLNGALRYVTFAALPVGEGTLVEQATLVRALDPAAAGDALVAPMGALSGRGLTALGVVAQGDVPLPFTDRELTVIQEEYPQARLLRGQAADREALLGALQSGQGVLHFAGHTRLTASDTGRADPLSGGLVTSDGQVTLLDVLTHRTQRELVVLSACETRLAAPASGALDGADLLSLAQAFHLAGAGYVLATTLRVHDVAAALMMKHFYREADHQGVAEALRAAQLEVKKSYPHPAWWAGFALSVGG